MATPYHPFVVELAQELMAAGPEGLPEAAFARFIERAQSYSGDETRTLVQHLAVFGNGLQRELGPSMAIRQLESLIAAVAGPLLQKRREHLAHAQRSAEDDFE